jgi:Tol biopolymer transport system component/DNA-binding winged helix-turn-helix (wHTH) protein
MRSSDRGPGQIKFGLFEVDLANAELRKAGRKVALQDQPFRVLLLLVQQPGEIVSREQLRQALWGQDTFVDFEESVNKAIQKVRQALDDSPENPRFIQTMPRKGYRFIAPVETMNGTAGRSQKVGGFFNTFRSRAILMMAALALIAGGMVTGLMLSKSGARAELKLTQLTNDTGLTFEPAISPDGKLIAYTSDRSEEGTLDIWVQQMPQGEPIRVAHHEADDHEPSFSPDGKNIVFRSERLGGGIYVVPALGGAEAKKIADEGRTPKYSPDGAWIAYWTGGLHLGKLYVIPTAGGAPRQLSKSIAGRAPIWSPDGTHVLYSGAPVETLECDWYAAPINGGTPRRTGIATIFHDRAIRGTDLIYPHPEVWVKDRSAVLFSTKIGDSTELWKVSISPRDWKVGGEPERLFSGPGIYRYPSSSDAARRIVFASLTRNADVWSLPIHRNRATGEINQLTRNAADDLSPSVSADGKRMVFESTRNGKRVVWAKDLETGRERPLTDSPSDENLPIISADGSQVVYQVGTSEGHRDNGLYVVEFDGGSSRRVCDDSCVQPFNWSADNMRVVYESATADVGVLDIRTGKKTLLLQGGECKFWGAGGLAPSEKWISFATSCRSEPLQLNSFIAPVRDGRVGPKPTWLPAYPGSRWSPDADSIYSISRKDGFDCLYVQPLDPVKGPIGHPQVLHHFHAAQQTPIGDPAWRGGVVARDKIVITLIESRGNIWMADEVRR